MIALVIVTPSYYLASGPPGARPLLETYRRLVPFEKIVGEADTITMVSSYALELHFYVGHNYLKAAAKTVDYAVVNEMLPGMPLDVFLNHRGITLFYVDEALLNRLQSVPSGLSLIGHPESFGWKLVASGEAPGPWKVFQKEFVNEPALSETPDMDRVPSASLLVRSARPSKPSSIRPETVTPCQAHERSGELGKVTYASNLRFQLLRRYPIARKADRPS